MYVVSYTVPRAVFGKIGGLDFLLKCDFEINKIPIALSKFHGQILLFWKKIFSHNLTPHNSVLWNNRTILISRKSVFNADWFDKGIVFVSDLMDDNGVFLSYENFVLSSNLTSERVSKNL